METFIFATDLHGDKQDTATVKALHAFTKEFRPKHRIFGGDIFDLRSIRRGASAEEQAESMLVDWEAGMEFLHDWRPTHVLEGNHDVRLRHLAASTTAGIKADYAMRGVQELNDTYRKLKCRHYPYHKRLGVLKMGKLSFLHGYHHGINACRQHAQVYGSCIFGHIHASDQASVAGLERRIAIAAPALCQTDMDYNSALTTTLRHSNGWVYGYLDDKTGEWQAFTAQRFGSKWIVPTGFKSVA
jgi:hypothetical protein